jgi:hypothetical protein
VPRKEVVNDARNAMSTGMTYRIRSHLRLGRDGISVGRKTVSFSRKLVSFFWKLLMLRLDEVTMLVV